LIKALIGFKSCASKTSDGVGAAATHFVGHKKEDVDISAGQPLLLKSLKSEDVEHTDKVEVHAILTSTGRQNSLLEQIVSRLSLESGVTGVSWEIIAEHE
jgi:uncharacterized membrane protein YhiD involved in acid resistance